MSKTLQYRFTAQTERERAHGTHRSEWLTLEAMRDELSSVARVLDAMVIGETVSITRLPDVGEES